MLLRERVGFISVNLMPKYKNYPLNLFIFKMADFYKLNKLNLKDNYYKDLFTFRSTLLCDQKVFYEVIQH